jgi:hypothetical protein
VLYGLRTLHGSHTLFTHFVWFTHLETTETSGISKPHASCTTLHNALHRDWAYCLQLAHAPHSWHMRLATATVVLQVNQLLLNYTWSNITFDSVATENLGVGDAKSAEIARPLSVSSANNFWALFYNRSQDRLLLKNVTNIFGSQVGAGQGQRLCGDRPGTVCDCRVCVCSIMCTASALHAHTLMPLGQSAGIHPHYKP